jgi:phospholipase/carboxylesterase
MSSLPFEAHGFEIRTEGRYLLHVPREGCETALIALHGYGMNPEVMLRLVAATLDGNQVIASLQGPNQQYAGEGPQSGIAAYNWGIRQHHPEATRVHHEMVLKVVGDMGTRFGILPRRCVLIGFSQPVGLNYRFIGKHPDAVGGVIGICGGVPKDWEDGPYQDEVQTPILHISRDQDEYFPVKVVEGFPARLRKRASNVEFHLLPGAHRYPSAAKELVRDWLERVLLT